MQHFTMEWKNLWLARTFSPLLREKLSSYALVSSSSVCRRQDENELFPAIFHDSLAFSLSELLLCLFSTPATHPRALFSLSRWLSFTHFLLCFGAYVAPSRSVSFQTVQQSSLSHGGIACAHRFVFVFHIDIYCFWQMFKFLRTHKKREEKQQNTARKEKNLFTYAREPETREKKQQRRIESFIDFFLFSSLVSAQLSAMCVVFFTWFFTYSPRLGSAVVHGITTVLMSTVAQKLRAITNSRAQGPDALKL